MFIAFFILRFILWVGIIRGITQIIVEANFPLFDGSRNWLARKDFLYFYKLLCCPLCVSVWIAMGLSLILWSPVLQAFPFLQSTPIKYLYVIFDGALGSLVAWYLYLLEYPKQKS